MTEDSSDVSSDRQTNQTDNRKAHEESRPTLLQGTVLFRKSWLSFCFICLILVQVYLLSIPVVLIYLKNNDLLHFTCTHMHRPFYTDIVCAVSHSFSSKLSNKNCTPNRRWSILKKTRITYSVCQSRFFITY